MKHLEDLGLGNSPLPRHLRGTTDTAMMVLSNVYQKLPQVFPFQIQACG